MRHEKATFSAFALMLIAAVSACPSGSNSNPPGPVPSVPDSGPSPPPPATSIQPLPASSFAFYRFASSPPEDKGKVHIWTYDIVTRSERLVSKVDNVNNSLRSKAGDRLSVSPDRRWIAFSGYFRPSKDDDFLGTRTTMIGKAAVDGSAEVRISAPLTDWRPVCSATCDPILACDPASNKCTPGGWSYGFEHPSWSPDGQTIFAHLYETACKNSSCLPSVVIPDDPPLSVITEAVSFHNSAGAKHMSIPRPKGPDRCNTDMATVSPDGKRLAVGYSGCFGSTSWGLIVSDVNGDNPQTISTQICLSIAWKADGTGVYCTTGKRLLLAGLDRTEKQLLIATENTRIDHFSISTDGRWFAVNLLEGSATDIHVADLTVTPLDAPGFKLDPVTADGNSLWPAF